MKLILGVMVLIAGTAGVGCTGDTLVPGAGSYGAGQPCTGSLGEVGQLCPPTFDGNLDSADCRWPLTMGTYRCDDLVVLGFGGDLGGFMCVYSASSQALVGAKETTDYNAYCSNESFDRTAGRVPPDTCYRAGPAMKKICIMPDGGR